MLPYLTRAFSKGERGMLDVIETCLYADDLEAIERFYVEVLGLDVFARVEGRHVFFRTGHGVLLLFNASETEKASESGIPSHGARGAGHVAFRSSAEELEAWKERLEKADVAIESEYTWPNGGLSIYFRDPSGNSLEFTTPRTWGLKD
jgi:catechol 2,3-dioxygenase-like lactoylglutathione lyase family enzyme